MIKIHTKYTHTNTGEKFKFFLYYENNATSSDPFIADYFLFSFEIYQKKERMKMKTSII